MGWQPGAGIGVRQHGEQEPLASQLDLKLDKKGLGLGAPTFSVEPTKSTTPNSTPHLGSVANIKLPVAQLNDMCLEQSWRFPSYTLIHESGPAHAKEFKYRIELNGQEYEGDLGSTKKLAKANAARKCLQQLRLLSRH